MEIQYFEYSHNSQHNSGLPVWMKSSAQRGAHSPQVGYKILQNSMLC